MKPMQDGLPWKATEVPMQSLFHQCELRLALRGSQQLPRFEWQRVINAGANSETLKRVGPSANDCHWRLNVETRGYLPTYILFFNLKESIVGPQSLALNSKYIHLHFNKSQLQRRHRHPGEFRQRQKSSINIDFLFKAHCRRRRIFSLCRYLGHNSTEFSSHSRKNVVWQT